MMESAVPEDWDRLRAAYEKFGPPLPTADMMQLTTTLGKAIPAFLLAAQKAAHLPAGAITKTFVVENTVALFHLLDEGVTGDAQHLTGGSGGPLAQLFPGGMEQGFVRPMAEQAVDQAILMQKRMRDI